MLVAPKEPCADFSTENDLQVGAELGAFRLTELVGRGSMASIFRAEHRSYGHQVALKVLHHEFCSKGDAVRRFTREIQVVQRARHPGVLEITDLVLGEEQPPFLVMELLPGEDLAACMARRGPLPPAMAVSIAVQVADALVAMHDRSVVHRDLKPANIFLVGGGGDDAPIVKVLDFGLAKFLYEEDPFLRTRTGCAIGTPDYMPPEQIRGDKVDHRIDIYATAAILFEMIAGRPPFHGGNVFDLVQKALSEPPPPPRSLLSPEQAALVPELLEQVILRCLSKSPEHRLQTAQELKDYLEASLIPGSDKALPRLPGTKSLRWPWVGGGLALAAVGAVIWLFTH